MTIECTPDTELANPPQFFSLNTYRSKTVATDPRGKPVPIHVSCSTFPNVETTPAWTSAAIVVSRPYMKALRYNDTQTRNHLKPCIGRDSSGVCGGVVTPAFSRSKAEVLFSGTLLSSRSRAAVSKGVSFKEGDLVPVNVVASPPGVKDMLNRVTVAFRVKQDSEGARRCKDPRNLLEVRNNSSARRERRCSGSEV